MNGLLAALSGYTVEELSSMSVEDLLPESLRASRQEARRQAIRLAEVEAEARDLVKINDERARILSNVSHELMTPLASILAFADILSRNKSGNLEGRQIEQINLIRKGGRRLQSLIDDLLALSRFDVGTTKLTLEEFSLNEMLREIESSLAPVFGAKSQEMCTAFPPGPLWIKADRGRLMQVFNNLLCNASKYSPPGAKVELAARTKRGVLTISVTDHGIGISCEDQNELFTPFFRSTHDGVRAEPGTGLGLAIAKSIILLHSGEITLRSELGVGTTVTVTLPGFQSGPSAEHLERARKARQPLQPHSRLDKIESL